MMGLKDIKIEDFTYNLPEERIAKYPLAQRDASKLLVYKEGNVDEYSFKDISSLVPSDTTLVFNNTKVIHARLIFHKTTGARIEIFCLNPLEPSDYSLVFQSKKSCVWDCIVGNSKKWKTGSLEMPFEYNNTEYVLSAVRDFTDGESNRIRFSWNCDDLTFGEVLEITGKIPVPPYLNRDSEDSDTVRYQTVYSKYEGSVAAPTAGLHFTDSVIESLKNKGVSISELTLHVGAGTFKPVKSENIGGHDMHTERISISLETVKEIVETKENVFAVGTTSVRTLESFYWIGVKLLEGVEDIDFIGQWEIYDLKQDYTRKEAYEAIYNYMKEHSIELYVASTKIIIVPGYDYKVIDAIVTNFHQPNSTLLLLVSALVGEDWHKIYKFALERDFRFLSYGDSSLLFKK
ncbi:MAG: S-adenosylmethionine:tRNA ribosyltransferase-isomerase [Marinifilaceae bacterium]|jgi:S-adenosylmethionine:tRNA ribosyltransferase-isomerase|nr:S-adenosylmethionine:tRNA ribosyltransferase-isomerase [Marinifilaceae bacterium]